MSLRSNALDPAWKKRLDLDGRGAPDFYENLDDVRDTPHAGAIRATLEAMGASAVFCVQGVPTIVIVSLDAYDRAAVVDLHANLWNQGLASLLLVVAEDTARAFSLSRTPFANPGPEFERRCLVETLDAVTDALALRGIVYGAESGRLWEEHTEYFRPKERVDQVLLENLTRSHALLTEAGLSPEAAQALLIQAMFIAYLEDREIIGKDYFSAASTAKAESFSALLETGSVPTLERLFASLRKDFNGDLFVAPSSFEPNKDTLRIDTKHLEVLARFRAGREEMSAGGQLRFWGYNFKHIPIELISAVYDRFLGEQEAERREHGAYYTPMFLADTVVSQVWDTLPLTTREKGTFLDPACGSGVFLVRSFQRLCEHWRETRTSRTIRWDSLLNILSRLHGWDLNGSAVRVAVFSLYIALLEQVSPPDIRQLIKRGKVLPELWGHTLKCCDFFSVPDAPQSFSVVIGNPPWTSRRGPNRSSIKWSAAAEVPMPGGEDAWAFTWKALKHLSQDGLVAFLLPAMGFLHNHADSSVAARQRLLTESRVRRVINFADLRFQLFEGAVRPAALIIFSRNEASTPDYQFDYWTPKADLNLKTKRLITLSSVDKSRLRARAVIEDPLIFKRRLWMSEPEGKLFNYLSRFSPLGNLVTVYGDLSRRRMSNYQNWAMGDGFKQAVPARAQDPDYDTTQSDFVGVLPHIKVEALTPLALSSSEIKTAKKWPTRTVHRKGFEEGYEGVRILIPRGVQVGKGRLRASYCEDSCTFSSIVQALTVPDGEGERAKLLTALLNSRAVFWFAFHGTASLGSDRPEIQKSEFMRLPFPEPEEMPDPAQSRAAAQALGALIDEAIAGPKSILRSETEETELFENLDRLVSDYFCLSPDEVALIDDAVLNVFPAVQPSSGSYPELWRPASRDDRQRYAHFLKGGLSEWFPKETQFDIALEAQNADLAVLKVSMATEGRNTPYEERSGNNIRDTLTRLFENIHQPLPGNFQLIPDLRVFVGKSMYLVKPSKKRFWLQSAALSDAGGIAMDLQDFVAPTPREERAQ